MITPKAMETIGKDFRISTDEARALVEAARKKGLISLRHDAFALPSLKKPEKPARHGKPMGRFDPLP